MEGEELEPENVLKMFCNTKLKEYKVNYLDDTSDFVSPDDFDGVEVILERL